jgi:DNA-binding NarL/FixJ family response regulator
MPDGIIRVLVADDHAVVRNGIAGMVNAQPDMKVVAEAPDGRTAIEEFGRHEPDISLIVLSQIQSFVLSDPIFRTCTLSSKLLC